jgi:hypothetical protein
VAAGAPRLGQYVATIGIARRFRRQGGAGERGDCYNARNCQYGSQGEKPPQERSIA